MSADNVIPLTNAADLARIVQQLAKFRERAEALRADIMGFANELPGNEMCAHPLATVRQLAELRCQLVEGFLGMFDDAVGGYLVPRGNDNDESTRATCAIRQIARLAAGLEVEEEKRKPSAPDNVVYPHAFRH